VSGSFSVVVPCYDYGRYLRQCVSSVLAQHVDVSVRILDDGSRDDTPVVGRALAAEDPRVTYQRHARNLGHIATYNEGLDWARATYTVVLSADDMLAPDALQRAREVFDAHPEVVMVHGAAVDFRDIPPAVTPPSAAEVRVMSGMEFVAECCAGIGNPIRTPTVVVRTSVQKAVGGYLPELPHAGDLEMWLRLSGQGCIAEIKSAVQAFYRVHDDNMTRAFLRDLLADERQLRVAFETFFERWAADREGADELRCLCSRRLAERGIWQGYRMVRQGRPMDALACLRFAVGTWNGRREDEVHLTKLTNAMPPVLYALRERRRRRGKARQAANGAAPAGPPPDTARTPRTPWSQSTPSS
jgi:glycosyltransferase involved in cell wall biosynthesis